MYKILKSKDRGHANHGWLNSYHTFSFGDFYNPNQMGFRALRVINEDDIAPGQGFPTHAHQDMEILTFVTRGELAHKDTLGNSAVIRPGEIQRMSAGQGIKHSEFNASKIEATHLLQIWVLPDRSGHAAGYEQKSYLDRLAGNKIVLLASADGRSDSVSLHQDCDLYLGKLNKGDELEIELKANRHGWLQIVNGSLECSKNMLHAGDGLAISLESKLQIVASDDAEFLFFDLN